MLAFRDEARSAYLSTLDAQGAPHSSVAPCLADALGVWVYLSHLSAHCRHLLDDPRVGVLLVGDESAAGNPFARQRLSLGARAEAVSPDNPAHEPVLDRLAGRFGETVTVPRQLPDFVLFRLCPTQGTYIEGFGRAFELGGAALDQLTHIDADRLRSGR